MDAHSRSLDRRTVLKGIGITASSALIGSASGGRAGAATGSEDNPDDFRFYAVTPSTPTFGGFPPDSEVPQYLIEIDPSDASTEVVTEIQFSGGPNDGNLQTPTLAFSPDGTLYGVAIRDNYVYELDPSTGAVTRIGDPHKPLRYMFGSAFTSDGMYHGVNTELDKFYSPIDYTESSGSTDTPVEVGDLVDQNGNTIDAIHTGLTSNQATDVLYATLGNQEGTQRDDIAIIDIGTGEITTVATDVFTVDKLVGTEFNPCTGELFTVRNGNGLYALDLATGLERKVGDLTITVDGTTRDVVTDNLAAKWVDCTTGCTRTIGYYKTHGCDPRGNNDNVVQTLLTPGIWLGQEDPNNSGEPLGDSVYVTESCAADEGTDGWSAEEILDVSGKKSKNDMLLAQLLAAKLNIRDGADGSEILDTILAADRYLAGKRSASGSTIDQWKDELDAYNNGNTGPGSCDGGDEKEREDGDEKEREDEDDEDERGEGRGRGRNDD